MKKIQLEYVKTQKSKTLLELKSLLLKKYKVETKEVEPITVKYGGGDGGFFPYGIVICFTISCFIFQGFFTKMGEDLYNICKKKMVQLINYPKERIINFYIRFKIKLLFIKLDIAFTFIPSYIKDEYEAEDGSQIDDDFNNYLLNNKEMENAIDSIDLKVKKICQHFIYYLLISKKQGYGLTFLYNKKNKKWELQCGDQPLENEKY